MKVLYILTWVMLLTSAANAQIDSTRSKAPGALPVPADTLPASDQYRKEDRVIIETSKVPAALRQTLEEGQQYRGWENSTIYFDRSTKQYVLTLTAVNSTRTYKFDENGKPVTDDDPSRDDH